jgi:hypothetical protein
MVDYKGYKILINDYNYEHLESVKYLFYNTNNCDEPGGTGSSIEDCKQQINYLVNEDSY